MPQQPLKLMIPGPVQPAADVLAAMGSPVQAHYGPGFTKTYNETLDLLRPVFGLAGGDVFLMVGSGSAGIDACLGSAFSTGVKVLVGMNGYFGERLKWICESYGLEVAPVEADWGKPVSAAAFEQACRSNPDARGACMVHLETSTAIANPVEEVAAVCRENGLLFFVDAVSSLGGLKMRMDEWGVDLCASATQKCLGAPPGLTPVAVSERAWEVINQNPCKNHGWYLNLLTWKHYAVDWASWHPFPVTMATNNLCALKTALEGLASEGMEARLERYRGLALRLRQGLRRIGMQPYTPDDLLAPVLTAAYGPPGVPTGRIVSYMANEHCIKISGGLGRLENKIIRIGHMSPTVTEADIDEVVEGLGEFSPA